MTKLYCIIGVMEGHGAIERQWPVCWRLTPEDAKVALDTCITQRDLFLEELAPIWTAMDQLAQTDSSYGRSRGKRRPNYDAVRQQEARYRTQRAKLDFKEAETNRRHVAEMLDPLYPTSTKGSEPATVEYKIIEVWEDPREMGAMELLKLRAKLHGANASEDETEPVEEWASDHLT